VLSLPGSNPATYHEDMKVPPAALSFQGYVVQNCPHDHLLLTPYCVAVLRLLADSQDAEQAQGVLDVLYPLTTAASTASVRTAALKVLARLATLAGPSRAIIFARSEGAQEKLEQAAALPWLQVGVRCVSTEHLRAHIRTHCPRCSAGNHVHTC
jgi:hypothetical protein